jgi:hypothetical protein
LSDELRAFVDLLDFDELRGTRPADFIFLCGGYSETKGRVPPYYSLRHFLLRHPTFQKRLNGYVVLAEDAQRIFDDDYYEDLISFEEDIARIASLIAIIAESPGSLSELGSFSSIEIIAKRTCAIQQREYENERSFITLGPVKRLATKHTGSVAYYPWKKNREKVFHTTCSSHVTSIIAYLNTRLGIVDDTFKLSNDSDMLLIFVVLWVIFLFKEVSIQKLYDTVKIILPESTDTQIKAKVYSLIVAKWVGEEPYEAKKYYYCCFDKDPFVYRYKETGHRVDDYKLDIVASLKADDKIPKHVVDLGRATRARTAK